MELLGDMGQVEACFCSFAGMLILAQGRCTICAEYTTGMEIFFAPSNRPPRWRGQIEAHFGLFGDSVNLDAR
jgi:hypothetical protein